MKFREEYDVLENYLKEKKILIIGGTGYIGKNLVNHLIHAGCLSKDISSLSRNYPHFPIENIRYLLGDLSNKEEVYNYFSKTNFDYDFIVHCGGELFKNTKESDKEYIFKSHLLATQNLYDLLLPFQQKITGLIYLGSAEEYGACVSPQSEISAPLPISLYGRAKFESTKYLIQRSQIDNFPLVIIRPYNVFGRGCKQGIIPYILSQINSNNDINITRGDQFRDFIHIDDLNRCILEIMKHFICNSSKIRGQIFNVGNGTGIQINEIVKFLCSKSSYLDRVNFGAVEYRQGEIMHICSENTKIKEYIDFVPMVNFWEGLELRWQENTKKN